jgi:NADH/NAD ratio-sensing transcriptional regulator Rex
VNFAPVPVKIKDKDVFVKQIDIDGELRILSARISVSTAL